MTSAANIYQLPTTSPASTGTLPNFKFMVCGNDLSTITTSGYLNQIDLQSNPISSTDILQILYNFNPATQVGKYGAFTVSIENGIITLIAAAVPGEVVLPVFNGDFANFIGTTGAIGDLNFRPSNTSNPVVTTTNLDNGVSDSFVPAFIGIDGTIGLLTNNSHYKFNGDVFAGDNATSIPGSCASSSGAPGGGHFFLTCLSNPGFFDSTILSSGSLGQDSAYNLIDAGVDNSTIAVFPAFPSVITPGNVLIAGPVNGTIADGGLPPEVNAVLLTPLADQVITQHELTIAEGDLNLGIASTSSGALHIHNANGTGVLNILFYQSGTASGQNLSIIPTPNIGQFTDFIIPDPGVADATFAVFPSFPSVITPGNVIVSGPVNGTVADGLLSISNVVINNTSNQMTTSGSLLLNKGTGTTTGGAVTLNNQAGVITTESITLPPVTEFLITMTNSFIQPDSCILLTVGGASGEGNLITASYQNLTTGSVVIAVVNTSTTSTLTGVLFVSFVIV